MFVVVFGQLTIVWTRGLHCASFIKLSSRNNCISVYANFRIRLFKADSVPADLHLEQSQANLVRARFAGFATVPVAKFLALVKPIYSALTLIIKKCSGYLMVVNCD